MSYLLFMDESGHDRREAPYEVLAGLAVEDQKLWGLIQRVQELELQYFGLRVSSGFLELKGKKLLKRKVFSHASQLDYLEPDERRALVQACLEKGRTHATVSRAELTALGQAKIAFVGAVLDICRQYDAKAFASIVPQNASRPSPNAFLRKDYAYLFERFFYYLEDMPETPMGLLIFDELDKSQSHILLGQVEQYFKKTEKGRERARLIIPEPFFVHSDLSTVIQLADIIAYIISWGVVLPGMTGERRDELEDLSRQVCRLRYRSTREIGEREAFGVWSFAIIDDLRPNSGPQAITKQPK